MKNQLLITIILLCSTNAWCQQDNSTVDLIVKFHPIPFFNLVRPYLQGSVELLFDDHWGVEAGYGRRHSYAAIGDTKSDSMTFGRNGHTILAEIYYRQALICRRKPNRAHTTFSDFFGINYRYINDQRNLQLGYNDTITNTRGMDYYGMVTVKDAWGLRWGLQLEHRRLRLELFGEIGVQNMSKTQVGFDDTKDHDRYYMEYSRSTYDGRQINLNAGFKVGYQVF